MLLKILTALAATLALAAGTASAASLPAGSTAILSGGPSLFEALDAPVGPSYITSQAVSADGRYVVFASDADGLVDGDDDRRSNVYRKDTATGAVELLSRRDGPAGEPAHDECAEAVISDDGLAVAFRCQGPLDDADTNGTGDIYVRRPQDGKTILVSRVTGDGAVGDDRSFGASISRDGEYVAFTSDAANLDPLADDRNEHVFRRHLLDQRETVLVSRKLSLGSDVAVSARDASISDSGDVVAYTTYESLDGKDTNGDEDVYVRTISAGMTVLASRTPGAANAGGNSGSDSPSLAGDASAVAFRSNATNFDPIDTDTGPDVYWRVLKPGGGDNTALVNVDINAHKGPRSGAPSVSTDGSHVAFVSEATNFDGTGDVLPTRDAYVKGMLDNKLQLVSRRTGANGIAANADARAVAISGDGKKAASFLDIGGITPDADERQANVILRDLVGGTTISVARPAGTEPFVNAGGSSQGASLSADGRFAAFDASHSALGLPHGRTRGVFVRDRVTGSVILASRQDGPEGTPFGGDSHDPDISADGRRVSFTVEHAPDVSGATFQVWVRDVVEGRTWLASRADGASPAGGFRADGNSSNSSLDADGTRVAFVSQAKNLGDGDDDIERDVHVRDLETDRTVLVSRADGNAGPKGNGRSEDPDINGSGARVAFTSTATNLGDGDPDDRSDVHLRDLEAGTTRLVSATPGGTKNNGYTDYAASIDASGERVAFTSTASNLAEGTPLAQYKVFVRDFAAGTLVLASRADGADGAPATGDAVFPVLSPDGGFVAFAADDLGAPTDNTPAYVRDLAAGRTELVSRRNSADGAPVTGFAMPTGISADGACVAFVAQDTLFGPYSDFQQAYLRALRPDCGAVADPTPTDPAGDETPSGPLQQPAADTVAPVLSGARLSRRRFRVARAATALAAKARFGTVLTFRSSEAGTLSIAVERRGKRGAFRRAGILSRRIGAGAGRVRLSGRLVRRRLANGRYRLTLTATDAAGNASRAVRLRFVIVK